MSSDGIFNYRNIEYLKAVGMNTSNQWVRLEYDGAENEDGTQALSFQYVNSLNSIPPNSYYLPDIYGHKWTGPSDSSTLNYSDTTPT